MERSYVYFLSRIDHIEHRLRDRHRYDVWQTVTRHFSLIFPFGLISLKGDRWKRHARFILRLLKPNKISPHFDQILQNIDRFIDQRISQDDGQIHTDWIIQCQHLLLNIIAQLALNLVMILTVYRRMMKQIFDKHSMRWFVVQINLHWCFDYHCGWQNSS